MLFPPDPLRLKSMPCRPCRSCWSGPPVLTQVAGWIIGKQGRHIRELQASAGRKRGAGRSGGQHAGGASSGLGRVWAKGRALEEQNFMVPLVNQNLKETWLSFNFVGV